MRRQFRRKRPHERVLGFMYYAHDSSKAKKPEDDAEPVKYREVRLDLWLWTFILRWDA